MKKILFLFVVFYCSNVFAQKNVTNQKLGWYVYVNTIEFNKKWFLITEVQERFFINPTSQHQLLLRTHLHRTIFNGFDVALKTDYAYISLSLYIEIQTTKECMFDYCPSVIIDENSDKVIDQFGDNLIA
jgi:hypothetical protein